MQIVDNDLVTVYHWQLTRCARREVSFGQRPNSAFAGSGETHGNEVWANEERRDFCVDGQPLCNRAARLIPEPTMEVQASSGQYLLSTLRKGAQS